MADIIEITDFAAPELDVYARLNERQLKCGYEAPEGEIFIAESPNVILRALDAGYAPLSLLMERKHIHGQAREIVARCGDVPLYTAGLDVLTQLTGFPLTRGVLCAMRRRRALTVEQALDGARRVAVLENVYNPTNVGAVFRSAAALGMDAVLLTPGTGDPLYRRTVRVSMGAVFQVPWAYTAEDVTQWPHPGLEQLRSFGFKTVAMALREDALPIDDARLAREDKLAILVGSEGQGLCEETIRASDYTAIIPMHNGVDSLNVATAAAVAFWQLGKK